MAPVVGQPGAESQGNARRFGQHLAWERHPRPRPSQRTVVQSASFSISTHSELKSPRKN